MSHLTLKRTICGQPIDVHTHKQPDLDETWALHLIECRATPAWLEQHAPNGVIELGINGGEFDEHVGTRKQTDCCATLVAKSLGLDQDPAFKQILKFLYQVDSAGTGHPFDLFRFVKLLNRKYPNDPERVIDQITELLDLKEAEQRDFVLATQELEAAIQRGQYREVCDPRGWPYLIVFIESDLEVEMSAAVKLFKLQMVALVQKNSKGQVQIYVNNGKAATNERGRIRLDEVAARLRVGEIRVQGKSILLDSEQAQAPGVLKDLVPEWYYFKTAEMIFNGSLTHPDTPATQLSFKEVIDRVQYGITISLEQNYQAWQACLREPVTLALVS